MEREQITAALILLYSGIDQMSWLARPAGKVDSGRSDFVQWVETYVFPVSDLECTAIDLYAARCGILHSQSAEARLTREEEATEIWYAWGEEKSEDLQTLYRFVSDEEDPPRTLHLGELHDAFERGVDRFLATLREDDELWKRVRPRTKKLLATLTFD